MKLTCISPNRGYDYCLTNGKEYEVVDIQEGIFSDKPYIIVIGDIGKKLVCHYWRFDISKEDVYAYIKNVKENSTLMEHGNEI